MFCHQDCLEEWLSHSKKDKCELCSTQYCFTPLYAEDTPAIVPPFHLIVSGLKIFFTRFLPLIFRIVLASAMWLIVVPVATSWLYRLWFQNYGSVSYFDFGIKLVKERFNLISIRKDAISGLVLTGSIALSFIVLMSFADFLRFNWQLDQDANLGANFEFPPRDARVRPGVGAARAARRNAARDLQRRQLANNRNIENVRLNDQNVDIRARPAIDENVMDRVDGLEATGIVEGECRSSPMIQDSHRKNADGIDTDNSESCDLVVSKLLGSSLDGSLLDGKNV